MVSLNAGQMIARIEEIKAILNPPPIPNAAELREELKLLNKLVGLLDPDGEHKKPGKRNDRDSRLAHPDNRPMPASWGNPKDSWNRSEHNRRNGGVKCPHCPLWAKPGAGIKTHMARMHPKEYAKEKAA